MIKDILKPHIPCCRCGNSKLGLGLNQASSLAMNDGTITCPECGIVGLVQFRHLAPVLLAIAPSLLWLSPTTKSAVAIDVMMFLVWLFLAVRHRFHMSRASTRYPHHGSAPSSNGRRETQQAHDGTSELK